MSDNSFEKRTFIELDCDRRVSEGVRYAITKAIEHLARGVGSQDIQNQTVCFEKCGANLTLVVGPKDDDDFQKIFNLGYAAGNGVGRNVYWIESYGVQAFWVGKTARDVASTMANFYFGIE